VDDCPLPGDDVEVSIAKVSEKKDTRITELEMHLSPSKQEEATARVKVEELKRQLADSQAKEEKLWSFICDLEPSLEEEKKRSEEHRQGRREAESKLNDLQQTMATTQTANVKERKRAKEKIWYAQAEIHRLKAEVARQKDTIDRISNGKGSARILASKPINPAVTIEAQTSCGLDRSAEIVKIEPTEEATAESPTVIIPTQRQCLHSPRLHPPPYETNHSLQIRIQHLKKAALNAARRDGSMLKANRA